MFKKLFDFFWSPPKQEQCVAQTTNREPKVVLVHNSGKFHYPNAAKYEIFCPGCNQTHSWNDSWNFNQDFFRPTISPSLLYSSS